MDSYKFLAVSGCEWNKKNLRGKRVILQGVLQIMCVFKVANRGLFVVLGGHSVVLMVITFGDEKIAAFENISVDFFQQSADATFQLAKFMAMLSTPLELPGPRNDRFHNLAQGERLGLSFECSNARMFE